jgi:hypothetical protein
MAIKTDVKINASANPRRYWLSSVSFCGDETLSAFFSSSADEDFSTPDVDGDSIISDVIAIVENSSSREERLYSLYNQAAVTSRALLQ